MLQSRVQAVELENVVDDTCADSSDYSLEIKEVTIQNSKSTRASVLSRISATTVSGSIKAVQKCERACGKGRTVNV